MRFVALCSEGNSMTYKHGWLGNVHPKLTLSSSQLTIIAGPCMFESRELGLKSLPVSKLCAMNLASITSSKVATIKRIGPVERQHVGLAWKQGSNGYLISERVFTFLCSPMFTLPNKHKKLPLLWILFRCRLFCVIKKTF